jgi:hypothetical protein
MLDEDSARLEVRVLAGQRQDRRNARVGAVEDLGPLGLGLAREGVGELIAKLGPGAHVVPVGWGDAEELDQLVVELGLDRPDAHVLAVGGLVHVVERRAGVEQVGAALLLPHATRERTEQHRGQVG